MLLVSEVYGYFSSDGPVEKQEKPVKSGSRWRQSQNRRDAILVPLVDSEETVQCPWMVWPSDLHAWSGESYDLPVPAGLLLKLRWETAFHHLTRILRLVTLVDWVRGVPAVLSFCQI